MTPASRSLPSPSGFPATRLPPGKVRPLAGRVFSLHLALAALVLGAWGCGPSANGETREATDASGQEAGSRAVASRPQPPRGKAWVIFGADTVVAEVARSAEERSQGLMFREEVPPGTGMLFVFDDLQIRSFWMKDTYVPLSIAFFDENHRVVDMKEMEPRDEEFTRSAAPALMALEVQRGWFEEKGIQVGDQAEIVFGVR